MDDDGSRVIGHGIILNGVFPAFLPDGLGGRDRMPSPFVLGDVPQCLGKQSIGFTGELFGVNA